MLLGERGQGKTRLIRTLVGLLDEWTPVVAGCEINDHPYAPVCGRCLALLATDGDLLPVAWLHRSERYGEKLATPDTSVGDLIGDVDPIKVAQGRTLGDPETIHFGLVPRTNRGIIAVNELPDLAERIQVALLNVLEERDIQVRGYQLRMPLDLLLVASANPEDYTNRGRIITPLKDRFGAEVRTHYPLELSDELALIAQEAAVLWSDTDFAAPLVPGHICSRSSGGSPATSATRRRSTSDPGCRRGSRSLRSRRSPRRPYAARQSPASRSPWPGSPTCLRSSPRRAARSSSTTPTRAASSTCSSTCCAARSSRRTASRLAGLDLRPLQEKFDQGLTVETGDAVSAERLLAQLGPVPVLSALLERLEADGIGEGPGGDRHRSGRARVRAWRACT